MHGATRAIDNYLIDPYLCANQSFLEGWFSVPLLSYIVADRLFMLDRAVCTSLLYVT
jgi:hypothetical protein